MTIYGAGTRVDTPYGPGTVKRGPSCYGSTLHFVTLDTPIPHVGRVVPVVGARVYPLLGTQAGAEPGEDLRR